MVSPVDHLEIMFTRRKEAFEEAVGGILCRLGKRPFLKERLIGESEGFRRRVWRFSRGTFV